MLDGSIPSRLKGHGRHKPCYGVLWPYVATAFRVRRSWPENGKVIMRRSVLVLAVAVGAGLLAGPLALQERLVVGENPYKVVDN